MERRVGGWRASLILAASGAFPRLLPPERTLGAVRWPGQPPGDGPTGPAAHVPLIGTTGGAGPSAEIEIDEHGHVVGRALPLALVSVDERTPHALGERG